MLKKIVALPIIAILVVIFTINLAYAKTCPRQACGFFAVAAEMTNFYSCNYPVSVCGPQTASSWKEVQERSFNGYDGGQWLWSGDATHTFNVVEQSNLIAQAIQWANTNKPTCSNGGYKTVISITFFTDVLVGNGGYFIGCKVKYGCCTPIVVQRPSGKK